MAPKNAKRDKTKWKGINGREGEGLWRSRKEFSKGNF